MKKPEIDTEKTKELNTEFNISCRHCGSTDIAITHDFNFHETLYYIQCLQCREIVTVAICYRDD